jgi:D-alanine-D-alanine ligase
MAPLVQRNRGVRITVVTWLETEQASQHDVVVDQVTAALERAGHIVSIIGTHGDVQRLLDGIRITDPELVFNLMEMFDDNLLGDVSVAGLLELCAVPYTGSGPGELTLCQDKALTKKLLDYEGIAYPPFAVFHAGDGVESGGTLRMPLFVKPRRADASIGVDESASIVHDVEGLARRVLAIHQQIRDDALAEEFVEGRELYVAILGNDEPEALPIIEIDFSGLPPGTPHVLGQRAKFDSSSPYYHGTRPVLAELSDELRAHLVRISLDAYRVLGVRDYGRVDLRVTDAGEAYVIEVNASCYLEEKGEFAMAARAAGLDYTTLVNRIAELALERFRKRTQPIVGEPAPLFSS